MIQLAAGWNYVAYEWDAPPEVTLAVALAPIWGYLTGAFRWNRETGQWSTGAPSTVLRPGDHWAIQMSQPCTLENFRWWVIHINEVVVADRAAAGAIVLVDVLMYNYRPQGITFRFAGNVNGVDISVPGQVNCPGGMVVTQRGDFVMPNEDAILNVCAYYWDGSAWVIDDWRAKTVLLEGEVTYAFTVGSPGVSAV